MGSVAENLDKMGSESPHPSDRTEHWSSRMLSKLRRKFPLRGIELFYHTRVKERFLWGRAQDDFYKIFGGHILFQVLAAAANLNLFDLIESEGELSAAQIAERLSLTPQPCRIMLLSLVSSRILRKRGERYSNTALSRKFLTTSGEWRFLNCLKWQKHINYRAMYHFEESLLSGTNSGLKEIPGVEPTLYQRLAHQPILEKIFQDAMQEISRLSNVALSRYIDFSKSKYLVDVGGGNATNIIAIARANPHLRASVFDFPSVCERASSNIDQHSLSDRLCAISGNIFSDELPTGADCFIFCHFFTIWSLEQNRQLLIRAYQALPIGGRALIFNMMQNDDGNGPMTAAVGSPYFLTLATGQGMLYSWSDYVEIFKAAGFRKVETVRLPRDHGAIIGTK